MAAALCPPGQPALAQTVPMPVSPQDAARALPTIALILPSARTPFARAAEAVRAGFMAAYKASGDGVAIEHIEIDERADSLEGALAAARDRRVSAVVGPLTRAQVNQLVESGRAGAAPPMPLVTLNYPEWEGGAPPTMLAFGLAIEHDARELVRTVLEDLRRAGTATPLTPRFIVVSGQGALARRAAVAFRDALRDGGERAIVVTPTLDRMGLDAMAAQVGRGEFIGAFLALDAREAIVVRSRLPKDMPLFATSLVHAGGAEAELTAGELEGVRFADMPWLLEPEHAAVMIYPRPDASWNAELQRLYALGIDAYRLAIAWMGGRTAFEIDGVTGSLRVNRANNARVERIPSFAVFRNGKVERLERAR